MKQKKTNPTTEQFLTICKYLFLTYNEIYCLDCENYHISVYIKEKKSFQNLLIVKFYACPRLSSPGKKFSSIHFFFFLILTNWTLKRIIFFLIFRKAKPKKTKTTIKHFIKEAGFSFKF